MKYTSLLRLLALLSILCFHIELLGQNKGVDLKGAWQSGPEENRYVWINSDKHFSVAIYNLKEKKFIGTYGGTWIIDGSSLVEVHEFNTIRPELIGQQLKNEVEIKNGNLTVKSKERNEEWTRVDNGTPGKLAGAWVITGRVNDGQVRKMTPGARKTMKILSGSRFQWIAYNSETKEFFGTGGGSYTSENGKYIEHIDLFSRDNSRVGAKLEFDFSIEDGQWNHKGLSSKGDPINEIWTKRETLGI